MKEIDFQGIVDQLQKVLPSGWDQVIFYAAYEDGSYSMKYYIFDSNGTYTDCFSQKDISQSELVKVFMDIDKILSPVRTELEGKDKWNVLTMILDKDGQIKVDFDYSDITGNSLEYERAWKKKYL